MCAKKSNKPSTTPETLVLTEKEMKLPEAKALLKRIEELKQQEEINSRLPKVLEFAGTTFGKQFKTFKGFVTFVTKLGGKTQIRGKQSPRLTDEQRVKIRELKKEGKTHPEIAAAVGCSVPQVNITVYAKKK
jgi:hypothetical protein